MTGDIMNQTSEVLTDAHMLAHGTQMHSAFSTFKMHGSIAFSDFDVQSADYNSAQSPTNWESIHGKDTSILCQKSSRLSIALDDKNPKCGIHDCGLT